MKILFFINLKKFNICALYLIAIYDNKKCLLYIFVVKIPITINLSYTSFFVYINRIIQLIRTIQIELK
ncbi:hypothetical protein FM106_24265 [Brachybacterium faecium]|nr:hypothetical protein FM106_24265 [Brachybacterium faecium]